MTRFLKSIPFRLLMIAILVGGIYFTQLDISVLSTDDVIITKPRVRSTSSPKASVESKAGRAEYFFNLMRDPATNEVPHNIRRRELAFAQDFNRQNAYKLAAINRTGIRWSEAGPTDVGGRTRALAFDVTNDQTLLAGGVAGGVWKTTDNGSSWSLMSDPASVIQLTSLAQDTRAGQTNIWYATSGEIRGNSASDRGFKAFYYGTGIFKSTDNGESWASLDADLGSQTSYDSPYDYITKVAVSPSTGTVLIASNGYGVYRSTDGGANFSAVVGGAANDYTYADFAFNVAGDVVAVVSASSSDNADTPGGVFLSTDDGATFSNITPASYPAAHFRSVIASAPSNDNTFYVYTNTGGTTSGHPDLRLHKLDINAGTADDRSANLPFFGDPIGDLDTQGSYNMILSVKPDDENLVIIGGTNLYRSNDGFSTSSSNRFYSWIGGYRNANNGFAKYTNHHPDQHVVAFSPTNSNIMWSGNDGGVAYTTNITASTISWKSRNNGYNITQLYTVEQRAAGGEEGIIGGAQDNGSPYFTWDGTTASSSEDISSGDGSHAYMGETALYSSSQSGRAFRQKYAPGTSNPTGAWSYVYPANASNQLFIHPFILDPNDEETMFYPVGTQLYRHTDLSSIPDFEQSGWTTGWQAQTGLGLSISHNITALTASEGGERNHVLYVAGYNSSNKPKVIRVENANTDDISGTDVSSDFFPSGGYPHRIAINPIDPDEALIVFSNYNIESVFHTTDGGANWTAIEGNLSNSDEFPGPSVRAAAILPYGDQVIYMVGTSTGLYTTLSLDGSSTVWDQESPGGLGNTVVEDLNARPSDGRILAATHGRGIFVGQAPEQPVANEDEETAPLTFSLDQNYPNPFKASTNITFSLRDQSVVTMEVFDLAGRRVSSIVSDQNFASGNHAIVFDGSQLASGTYLYKLTAHSLNGETIVKSATMTLTK